MFSLLLEHDPEKWKPVFAKDHAQAAIWSLISTLVGMKQALGGLSGPCNRVTDSAQGDNLRFVLPLIALPGTSPRFGDGEKDAVILDFASGLRCKIGG
ncbi:hypothetical protein [Mesorhizobium sangaii]|uniref:Uncharacterized protein n=1 Tax=Mesorhizobium sangaii TaxID=505389 RepID=A0A841P1H2_9HYPH|nr:hypothetical protein [Mesorhizobium sangaii]MBB6409117.1 hypothetical protein [Mesorhizobium sangaii]